MKIREAAGMTNQNMWMFGCDQPVKYRFAFVCGTCHTEQSVLGFRVRLKV